MKWKSEKNCKWKIACSKIKKNTEKGKSINVRKE